MMRSSRETRSQRLRWSRTNRPNAATAVAGIVYLLLGIIEEIFPTLQSVLLAIAAAVFLAQCVIWFRNRSAGVKRAPSLATYESRRWNADESKNRSSDE